MRKLSICALMIFILFMSFGSAFSVVSDYDEDKPLEIFPGETKRVGFRIQNLQGDEDIRIRSTLKGGSRIATLVSDEDVLVSSGTIREILVDVKVPDDAELGDSYTVRVGFDIMSPEGEAIPATSQEHSIGVLVGGLGVSSVWVVATLIIIIILLVLVILLIVLILRQRKVPKEVYVGG